MGFDLKGQIPFYLKSIPFVSPSVKNENRELFFKTKNKKVISLRSAFGIKLVEKSSNLMAGSKNNARTLLKGEINSEPKKIET